MVRETDQGENMTLHEYVDQETERTGVSRRKVLAVLAERSGVSLMTLGPVDRGAKMQNYPKAKAIEDATRGKVTIKDLCE